MERRLTKTIIGVAVSYGLISQNTADGIQAQTGRTLSTDQTASNQQPARVPQNSQAPPPRDGAAPAPRP